MGSSDSDKTELIVAAAALVVSFMALGTTTIQAIHQFYSAAASGIYSCSEPVIGKWAAFTKKSLTWPAFRVQVSFEVPVIFAARPSNDKGPLGKHPEKTIYQLDGSDKNLEFTSAPDTNAEAAAEQNCQLIHTADNEKVTWCALLMAVYRMEKESRDWQKAARLYTAYREAPPHELVVCFQRKKRTWDGIHRAMGKPYATTTISHLVEIVGMLGIHWKEFDLNNDKYRAQGNGFVIHGSNNSIKYFRNAHEGNRHSHLFPVAFELMGMVGTILHVKETVFRMLPNPTIFQWDTTAFSISTLVLDFTEILQRYKLDKTLPDSPQMKTILEAKPEPDNVGTLEGKDLMAALRSLHQKIEDCDKYLKENGGENLGFVKKVVCVHMQAVLGLLNPPQHFDMDDDEAIFGSLQVRHAAHHARQRSRSRQPGPDGDPGEHVRLSVPRDRRTTTTIEDIDSASFSERHRRLMEAYVTGIRETVVEVVFKELVPQENARRRRLSVGGRNTADSVPPSQEAETDLREGTVNEIWCTLMFRMLCWLQLHDFHRMDVQMSKSDVYESRMPVYVV
ncbi:unnamed protein product [Parascedosporium putredinis]|uniref:Modin n=1 Tax=Parascedosporium putredinis TaxID=1442378 RepID=A0A9P1M7U2_9PEZI|nr:unnamed protein product [Parascedosporium putredinis]CAI7992355.1 unnamed protein product [Parascedosporium putredinis]